MITTLPITSVYAAVFGLFLIPITIVVGLRRIKTATPFLDGGDETLLRRVRGHANFLEYVPFALLLMGLAELNAAPAAFMHAVGATLLIARTAHYATLTLRPLAATRPLSMLATMAVFLANSGFLIHASI
ncbi:MAG: MAPEG family protein [Kiloniellales bacterium]|nr:MAPEG family protein [Kiloniellales bacterium]